MSEYKLTVIQVEMLRLKLEDNIVHSEACWLWNKGANSRGRGKLVFSGETYSVTRLALQIFENIAVSRKAYIIPLCGNPLCINTAHLGVGRHQLDWSGALADVAKRRSFPITTPEEISEFCNYCGYELHTRPISAEEAFKIRDQARLSQD